MNDPIVSHICSTRGENLPHCKQSYHWFLWSRPVSCKHDSIFAAFTDCENVFKKNFILILNI